MWVFSIVTVEITDPLLGHVLNFGPMSDKIAYVLHIHKLNVVQVSVLLSSDADSWGHALIAHCFRVWLVVFACLVDFVSHCYGR